MKHITGAVLMAGALVGAATPAAAQDPQWVRDLESQIEASATAVAQASAAAVAQALGQVDRDRLKADRDRVKAERDRERARRDAGRGQEYTEEFTQTVRLGQKGTLDLTTIAGDVIVNAGGGNDVKIDAVKRARGGSEADARAALKNLSVRVNQRSDLIEVRTEFPGRTSFPFITVDYTVTVPAGTSLTLKTVSGDVQITGVRGDIAGNSVSGSITVRNSKPRAIEAETVSGDVRLTGVESDRVELRTVSGDVEYSGKLARSGRYDLQSHSGDIRVVSADSPGFDIEASTFSGDIQSEYPVTMRGIAGNSLVGRPGAPRTIRGSFGDASAILTLRSFSGDISIAKK